MKKYFGLGWSKLQAIHDDFCGHLSTRQSRQQSLNPQVCHMVKNPQHILQNHWPGVVWYWFSFVRRNKSWNSTVKHVVIVHHSNVEINLWNRELYWVTNRCRTAIVIPVVCVSGYLGTLERCFESWGCPSIWHLLYPDTCDQFRKISDRVFYTAVQFSFPVETSTQQWFGKSIWLPVDPVKSSKSRIQCKLLPTCPVQSDKFCRDCLPNETALQMLQNKEPKLRIRFPTVK